MCSRHFRLASIAGSRSTIIQSKKKFVQKRNKQNETISKKIKSFKIHESVSLEMRELLNQ